MREYMAEWSSWHVYRLLGPIAVPSASRKLTFGRQHHYVNLWKLQSFDRAERGLLKRVVENILRQRFQLKYCRHIANSP
jgi:hypothetical protein